MSKQLMGEEEEKKIQFPVCSFPQSTVGDHRALDTVNLFHQERENQKAISHSKTYMKS